MARVLKKQVEFTGTTSSQWWNWKQVVSQYWDDTSIEKNTSIVVVKSYLGRGTSSSYFEGTATVGITCDGVSRSKSNRYSYTAVAANKWAEMKSEEFTVEHNDDGSKIIEVKSSLSAVFSPNTASASGSLTLITIPRASTIACSSPYIGDVATITIDKKSTTFLSTVTCTIGSFTTTVADRTNATVLSLKTADFGDTIYGLIPNSREIEGTIYCTTYEDSTQIGETQSATFNLYAKESVCKPTVNAQVIDTNEKTIAITGDPNKFIKYISKPKVTITATANKGASITSYSINLNDGQTSNLSESTFNSIGSSEITVNATDTRGYSNPTTKNLSDNMINYIKLHIDNIEVARPEETSPEIYLTANGEWYNGSFNETNINTLSVRFQYKKSGDTNWIDGGSIIPTINGNFFTFTDYSLGSLFNYENEYQLQVILEDKLMTVGNLNSDVITIEQGQESVAIGEHGGYLYGTWNLNDKPILEYEIVDSWE